MKSLPESTGAGPQGGPAIFARLAVIGLLGLALATSAAAQSPERSVMDIRVGFQQAVKPGYWIPVAVDVASKDGEFQGELHLTTPDGDGLNTTTVVPNVYVPRDSQITVNHFVKVGSVDATIVARMMAEGRVAAERELELTDPTQRVELLMPEDSLMVIYGSPAGLAGAASKLPADKSQIVRSPGMTRTISAAEWPVQWFALGSVDAFFFTTGSASAFDRLDPLRASALETWVRQGGHLVVSVAKNWQVVSESFLGRMLPATLTGVGTIREPSALEAYATGSPERMRVKAQGLSVAEVASVRGKTLIGSDERPLALRGNYGLGTVTLLLFDTDVGPFQTWDGNSAFWTRLLDLKPVDLKTQGGRGIGQVGFYGVTDQASALRRALENFPDVKVVPFGWVALLIFGYILLIGPIDYLFLKKVVGRLELTWITFPTWVVLISVAAYFAAHWLKGDDLRINRIEIVDVDVESSTLRGTDYMAVFSPQVARYSVAMTPGFAAAGAWSDLTATGRQQTDRVSSWLGVPESGMRGVYSRGSTGLLGRRGYYYQTPYPEALLRVPIQVWSLKTFENRWLAKAGDVLSADLRSDGLALKGTIANLTERPLVDVVIAHGSRVYPIERLAAKDEPGSSVELASIRPRTLAGYLGGETLRTSGASRPAISDDVVTLVRSILFAGKTPESARQLPSNYFRDMDLSDHLDLGKAILLARVPGVGGKLWLNDLPAPGKKPSPVDGIVQTDTFVRLILQPKEEQR